ncbi:hypothetical protein ACK35A_06595 [Aeromonas veronii]
MNIVELKKNVSDFRGALDRLDWFSMPGNFRKFPLGTCGAISDILAEHLYKQGIQEIEYVSGQHRQNSHAWLVISVERWIVWTGSLCLVILGNSP